MAATARRAPPPLVHGASLARGGRRAPRFARTPMTRPTLPPPAIPPITAADLLVPQAVFDGHGDDPLLEFMPEESRRRPPVTAPPIERPSVPLVPPRAGDE